MVKQQFPTGISSQEWNATPKSVQTMVYTLLATVAEMQQSVEQLQVQNEQQQKRIAQLEEQVGQNSRNSSKPPASDPPTVKKPPAKAKGERQRGGQPGHKGRGRKLKPATEVSRFVVSKPSEGLIGYLSGRFSVNRRDVQEMMTAIFQVEMSLGAVSAQEAKLSAALEQPVAAAQHYVQQQAQANIDETSWQKHNKRQWLWTATTEWVTIFLIVAPRGAYGCKQLLGAAFDGFIGSDRWSAYNWLPASQRQLCWAHLLRDFQAFVDRKGESAVIGQALLKQAAIMFHLWQRVRDGTLTRPDFQQALRPLRQEVETWLAVGTFVDHAKTAKTCANILKLAPALWAFVEHEGLEPTNNAAERALRRGVLWRKRSFGSQSDRGVQFTERILTTVTTLRQQQRNVLDFLMLACQAQHLGLPAPSLLPVNSDVDPVFIN